MGLKRWWLRHSDPEYAGVLDWLDELAANPEKLTEAIQSSATRILTETPEWDQELGEWTVHTYGVEVGETVCFQRGRGDQRREMARVERHLGGGDWVVKFPGF